MTGSSQGAAEVPAWVGPTESHGCRFEHRIRYAGGLVGYEPLFVTEDMIDRAGRALADCAGDLEAYDRGFAWALEHRDDAEVALRAALCGSRREDGGGRS